MTLRVLLVLALLVPLGCQQHDGPIEAVPGIANSALLLYGTVVGSESRGPSDSALAEALPSLDESQYDRLLEFSRREVELIQYGYFDYLAERFCTVDFEIQEMAKIEFEGWARREEVALRSLNSIESEFGQDVFRDAKRHLQRHHETIIKEPNIMYDVYLERGDNPAEYAAMICERSWAESEEG